MKILFVTPRFPFPHDKGDQLRVFHAIRHLSERHTIGLVSASDAPVTEASLAEMRRYCDVVKVVPIARTAAAARMARGLIGSELPLQVLYFESSAFAAAIARELASGAYDLVHAQLLRVLPHLWKRATPPVVVDLMDGFALSLAGRRDRAHPFARPIYEFERRRIASYEARAISRFPELIVAADGDRAALGGATQLTTVGNGVDLGDFRFGDGRERDPATVVMTGNMGYGPNVDAAAWFAREIWPRIRAERSDARLRFVGAGPVAAVRALASDAIEVTGSVLDVNAELRSATIAICPMRTGTGVQNKVLEALASGTPLVSTTLGNRGVGAQPGRDFLLADDATAFAGGVLALLADPVRRDALARAGRNLMETAFDWSVHAAALERVYARAITGVP